MFRQNFHALLSVNHSAPQQYNGIEKDPGAKLQHKRPTPCYPIVPKQKLVRRSELSKFIGNVVCYAMRHAKGSYRLTDNKHFVFFFILIFIPIVANYLLLSSFDATFYDPHIRVHKFSYVLLLPKIVLFLFLFCCVRSFFGVNRLLGSVSLSSLCYAWIFEYIGKIGVPFGGICCNFGFIISFLVPY